MMEMTFPGGVAVDARYRGFTIRTDQSSGGGGAGAAPAPFDLFLAAIGTCAGYYALAFCQQRGLSTAGLAVRLDTVRDPARHRIASVRLMVELPEDFPERYRDAIVRAIDQCAVKRHIEEPPEFTIAVGSAAPVEG
jgi:ribosomal protein S12 methylthiotransferase accessory factor